MSESKSVKPTPAPKAQKKPKGNPSGGKGKGAGGPQIPHFLKLSPKYLQWKLVANKLAADLEPYSLSISELGKAIAEYSAMNCQFEIDKRLVHSYMQYEEARIGWEHFRDSFRAQHDASSVPVGVAAKLLAGAASSPPPSIVQP